MAYVTQLAINDLRNIVRDRMLGVSFVAYPLIIVLVARLLLPWINDHAYNIEPYYPLLFMMLTVLIPFLFSFIIAFLVIDERDENLLTVLRVMPISRSGYLAYRMLFIVLFAFIFVLASPVLTGLVEMEYVAYLPVAVLLTMLTPVFAMLVALLANNKVQAFAVFKILGSVVLLPLFAFFIAGNLKFAFGALPQFWTFMSLEGILVTGTPDPLYLGIGYAYHIALLAALFHVFNKKI